uniref:Proline and serine-rich protein 2 n=1 Tax=Oncorhynchus mykiss TaxID=8022 RepID=A0A8K9VCD2_ONCMY
MSTSGWSLKHSTPNERQTNSRSTFSDKALHFLSQEEQDCILFFEETIDSLLTTPAVDELDGPGPPVRASAPSLSPVPPLSALDRPTKDQDIIDLVRPAQTNLVHPTHAPFNPPVPGTEHITRLTLTWTPYTSLMTCPLYVPPFGFFPKYNLPLPGKDSAPYGHALYQPVGSVPTPVRIAQKIAEHQGSVGNTNILSSSLLPNCRRSLNLETLERPPTHPDYPIKQDPTTSAKPTHYPNNISMIMGSNQHHSHSLASVNLQDRKSQMLANLSGTTHPVEAEELHGLQKAQVNLPTRSVSFKDPTPNKSRMEALSKLGLNRNSSTNTKPTDAPIPVATSTPVPMHTPTLTPVTKPDVARQPKGCLHQPPPPSQPKEKPCPTRSRPSFRSQGITVQFSGRGVTDESRREALRKLGLLKDTF